MPMHDATTDIRNAHDNDTQDENTNIRYVKIGNTTIKLVEHFSGNKTYSDIIRDALRREFSK